jgi:hypothetical protein
MGRYIVTRDYQSHRGRFVAGQVVDLEDEFAAWLNRDSRGVVEPVPPSIPAPVRSIETPPQDRMVKRASKRGER